MPRSNRKGRSAALAAAAAAAAAAPVTAASSPPAGAPVLTPEAPAGQREEESDGGAFDLYGQEQEEQERRREERWPEETRGASAAVVPPPPLEAPPPPPRTQLQQAAVEEAVAVQPATASVVLLIGWMGGSRRALQRYVDMHEKREAGVLVVPVCVTVEAAIWRGPQAAAWKEAFDGDGAGVEALRDAGLLSRKASGGAAVAGTAMPRVVVHLFSNGGMTMFHALQRLYPAFGRADVVRAMIWDSAPGDMTLSTGLRALMETFPRAKPFVYGTFASLALLLLARLRRMGRREALLLLAGAAAMLRVCHQRREAATLYHRRVQEGPPTAPTLVLYSAADKLVSCATVERVAAAREALGVRVGRRRWEDSPHVAHGKVHAKEYAEAVARFLADVPELPPGD